MKTVAILLALLGLALPAPRADTVTLLSGEIVDGEIVAESPAEYRVRVANADYTITSVRVIAPAEVKSVARDNPAQKAERAAYEAVCDYRLQADREQPFARCQQAVAALEDFLKQYPRAASAPRVKSQLTGWQDELAHVSQGLAKFQNRWLTPAAKPAAVREAWRAAQRQTIQRQAQQLRRQIAEWTERTQTFSNALVEAKQNLATATKALADLRDFTSPVTGYRLVGDPYPSYVSGGAFYFGGGTGYWEQYVAGERVFVHPARPGYEQRVLDYQNRVDKDRADLAEAQRQLAGLRAQLAKTETALAALAK